MRGLLPPSPPGYPSGGMLNCGGLKLVNISLWFVIEHFIWCADPNASIEVDCFEIDNGLLLWRMMLQNLLK